MPSLKKAIRRPILLCEDHVGTYVIPFLCRLTDGVWHNADTGSRIEATVIGWRAR